MTNGNDPIYPYAWQMGEDGKTAIINTDPVQLTKLEYFAIQAQAAILSNADLGKEITKESGNDADKYLKITAGVAVLHAKALIAALNEKIA